MDYAGAIEQTYRIPRQTAIPPQAYRGGAAEDFNDGIAVDKNLQEVEGKTEAYYQKVAALKAFMLDMHKNQGIDVRIPDMSKPESIKLNRIYQKALADIMHTGNLLHEGQVERSSHINRGDLYTQASRGKADSQMVQGQDYYSQPLPQDITQVNDLTQQPSYDSQSYNQKLQVYNSHKIQLERQIADAKAKGLNSEYLEYQLRGLTPPAQAIKQFAPDRTRSTYQDRRLGREMKNAGIMLKKLVTLKNGLVNFEPTTKIAPSGDVYEVNNDYKGMVYGKSGKTIASVRRDPGKGGKTEFVFSDGSTMPLNNADVTQIAQNLAAGQNMGYSPDALQQFILDNNYEGELGTLDESSFMPSEKEQKQIRATQKTSRAVKSSLIKPIATYLEEFAKKQSKPALWGTHTEDISLGNGINIELGRHKGDDVYTVENILSLIPRSTFVNPKTGKVDGNKMKDIADKFKEKPRKEIIKNLLNTLPLEDFQSVYDALGIKTPAGFNRQEEQAQEQPQTTPDKSEADKKAQELIEKYSKK